MSKDWYWLNANEVVDLDTVTAVYMAPTGLWYLTTEQGQRMGPMDESSVLFEALGLEGPDED